MARYVPSIFLALTFGSSLHAEILMRIPIFPPGDSMLPGYGGWFELDRVQVSMDRTLDESNGTEDINIGIAKIDRFMISKPTGVVSTELFRFAINGNSIGPAEIRVVEVFPHGVVPTAAWEFDRAFVASYSIESAGEELVDEFSLVFNKVLRRDSIEIGLAENGGDPSQEGCFFEVDDVETAFVEMQSNGLDRQDAGYRIDQHGGTFFRVFFVVAPDGLCYCLGQRQS